MPPPLKDGIYNFGSEVNRNFSKNNLKFGAIFELSRERREGERVTGEREREREGEGVSDRKKIVGAVVVVKWSVCAPYALFESR